MPTSASSFSSYPPPAKAASYVAIGLFCLMAVIQIAISIGLLPVTIVWGGSQKERTLQNSLASALAALILVGMAWIIHRRRTHPSRLIRVGSWVISFYMVLNTVGNLLSSSLVERYLFGSMTTALAISCFVVSCSTVPEQSDSSYETL